MDTVRGWIREARHLVVLTGAGMSAESGVPTFRDAQTGLWAQFNPQDLATESAFRAHPQRVWDWYEFRREAIARVQHGAQAGADRNLMTTVDQAGLAQRGDQHLRQGAHADLGVIQGLLDRKHHDELVAAPARREAA